VPVASAVEGDDPGEAGKVVALVGGALLESILGTDEPGTPVGLAGIVAAESLAADLAGESDGAAGVDFIATVSWAGG
jgi:hypothetical protein